MTDARARSGRHITAGLDAQTPGVRTTRLVRPRTSSLGLRVLACAHTRSMPRRWRHRVVGTKALLTAEAPCNACHARRRRVHRCPAAVRDDRDPPLVSGRVGRLYVEFEFR